MGVEEKLNKWAALLLDTGKRNPLISFKGSKTRTLEILTPSSHEVFDLLMGGRSELEVAVPPQHDSSCHALTREDARSQVVLRKGQVLAFAPVKDVRDTLRSVMKSAQEHLDETGVGVAYLAFGFLHWSESDDSQIENKAPLLLLPIALEQKTPSDPYLIKLSDDEVVVNPAFDYRLSAERGLSLPEYEDGSGLQSYLATAAALVGDLRWRVTDECMLGLFSFSKISMYRDVMEHLEDLSQNSIVRRLLGESVQESVIEADVEEAVGNPLIDLHCVADADSSQIEAIEMAKAGKSFVIQGPPGTGKSQTITNIIAECLYDGKTVLFVSEKQAALNVVYEKLNRSGLADYCLALHSNKSNKKDVIADLYRTLHLSETRVTEEAERLIREKAAAQNRLDSYARELHEPGRLGSLSVFQLLERWAALREAPTVSWFIPDLASKGEEYREQALDLLAQYEAYLDSVGLDYRENPWYGFVGILDVAGGRPQVEIDLRQLAPHLEGLARIAAMLRGSYGAPCGTVGDIRRLQGALEFIVHAELPVLDFLEKEKYLAARELVEGQIRDAKAIESAKAELGKAFSEGIYELDGRMAHEQLVSRYGSIFRIFNSGYRDLARRLKACSANGQGLSYGSAVELTSILSDYQKAVERFEGRDEAARTVLGHAYRGLDTNWTRLTADWDKLSAFLDDGSIVSIVRSLVDSGISKGDFASLSADMAMCLNGCQPDLVNRVDGYFGGCSPVPSAMECEVFSRKISNCVRDMERLPNWCRFSEVLTGISALGIQGFVEAAIDSNVQRQCAQAFERRFYEQWIEAACASSSALSVFNRILLDRDVSEFAKADKDQLRLNRAEVRSRLSAAKPVASGKLVAGSPIALLCREGEKKRKQMGIRRLLSATRDVVQRIKPCFLMSPLSVSTYLEAGALSFDVVIFDEASQVFPQDAIGAIYRSRQMIVVGDSQQMPPSNYFNATSDMDDDVEEVGDVADFESVLDLACSCFSQMRLLWHYRSRHESLIAFSNRHFYYDSLVTFPSARVDGPGVGVDYCGIRGVFNRQSHTNMVEAQKVVDLVFDHVVQRPGWSLGVVAFNKKQGDLIDRLVAQRRQENPGYESFFSNESEEPFFVKNLETVQGDERDVIIFSVTYAHDAQGRFIQNFGPLNREGGERRLNVAATRAKHNVILVSSIHYTDVRIQEGSSRGAQLLREYLDYAENGPIALERGIAIEADDHYDSPFEMEVCDFLRAQGFLVDTQVGCSGFKIDLGLRRGEGSDYVLAIECDGASYHSSRNARDRDRLRQEVLEGMGWRFYRIWSTDWFRNGAVERERLLDAVRSALKCDETVSSQMDAAGQGSEREGLIFEEEVATEESVRQMGCDFPKYRTVDFEGLRQRYPGVSYVSLVKSMLKEESPLSEEWLLRRSVEFFGRQKVTKYVRERYEASMRQCQGYGIERRDGFLWLTGAGAVAFRAAGVQKRDMDQIALEELADGILKLLELNRSADKQALFRQMAQECGYQKLTQGMEGRLDRALRLLFGKVQVQDGVISLS